MAPRPDENPEAPLASSPDTHTPRPERYGADPDETRQAALEKELQGVRSINEVIEGVINTLDRAKGNMETVSKTVDNASVLLNTWTRILSQTEHNQRLILNPEWKGATQDLVDMENEALEKQQAAQRKVADDARRRIEARRKQEKDEEERQRRAESSTSSTHGTRGTRGTRTRSRSTSSGSGYVFGGVARSHSTRAGFSSVDSSSRGRASSSTAGRGTRGGSTRYGRARGGASR